MAARGLVPVVTASRQSVVRSRLVEQQRSVVDVPFVGHFALGAVSGGDQRTVLLVVRVIAFAARQVDVFGGQKVVSQLEIVHVVRGLQTVDRQFVREEQRLHDACTLEDALARFDAVRELYNAQVTCCNTADYCDILKCTVGRTICTDTCSWHTSASTGIF